MMALSPPLFSTAYGWPLEDHIAQNLQHGHCNEANSYQSLVDFPTFDPIQQDFVPKNSISSGANGGTVDDLITVAKKLNHNASERDRRKRVNDLYAFLRLLLPMPANQKKKVSIPGTVSRALKYIPELQKEVETLLLKREKLRSYSSSTATRMQEPLGIKKQSAKDTTIKTNSLVVSSVSVLGEKEAVIQLIFSTDHMSKNKEVGLFSKVLEYLEQEEDGFVLLNVTSFKCSGEGRLLNTLHLQVQGDNKIEAENLKEKLCSFQQ